MVVTTHLHRYRGVEHMFRFMMVYLTLKRYLLSVLQDFPLILKTQNTRMALLIMYHENKKYLLEL